MVKSTPLRRQPCRSLTCYHGEKDKQPPLELQALRNPYQIADSIEKFYDEAARRLPLEEIPKLVSCIYAGGFCFGLADPVSNIILNAIDLLDSDLVEEEDEEDNTVDLLASDVVEEEDEDHSPLRKKIRRTYGWNEMALFSHAGLLAFIKYYFRYLTDIQARRYLHLAGNDLLLAIKLVTHDRFLTSDLPILPDGGIAKAALSIAASEANHPAPDDLARLMTAKYPAQLLSPILAKLQDGKQQLTTADVWAIRDMLAQKWPPIPTANIEFLCPPNGGTTSAGSDGVMHLTTSIAGESHVAVITIQSMQKHSEALPPQQYISDTTFGAADLKAKRSNISAPRVKAHDMRSISTVHCDNSPCDHIVSIKLGLLETIYTFFITAITRLPRGDAWKHRGRFLRALLLSGHCYGPLDPVSNIILNAIWYDNTFPPPNGSDGSASCELEFPPDIFDTEAISCMVACSLDKIVTLYQAAFQHTFPGLCSEHEVMEYLWLTLFETILPYKLFERRDLIKAIKPVAYALPAARFLMSLVGKKLNRLRNILSKKAISDTDWEELNMIVSEHVSAHGVLKINYAVSTEASSSVPSKRSAFINQEFVRANLQKILRIYGEQHPWEPKYKLDIIFGVEGPTHSTCKCYHLNFLTSTHDSPASGDATKAAAHKAFFAELWESNHYPGKLDKEMPAICMPIKVFSGKKVLRAGRCCFCEDSSSNILHPSSGKYSWSEDSINVSYCSAVSNWNA